jgi:hypothetical protein
LFAEASDCGIDSLTLERVPRGIDPQENDTRHLAANLHLRRQCADAIARTRAITCFWNFAIFSTLK